MHLAAVKVRHFRNVAALDWVPAPGINLIWGDNGQGKTNLLEAISLALTGRSFRTRRDEQCLPWGRPEDPADPTLSECLLAGADGQCRLRLTLGERWKRAFRDGQILPRLADLWSQAALVSFTPEDAGLFKASPADRRRYLDMLLSQLSPIYLQSLQRYNQALRQLNALMKRPGPEAPIRDAALAYHIVLAEAGAILIEHRTRRLETAAAACRLRHTQLGGALELDLAYAPGSRGLAAPDSAAATPSLAERLSARFDAAFPDSRRAGSLETGPHRDDFTARLDGHDLRRFGSQGQHRLVALTLKLESAAWLQAETGEAPILLLDDFGSELDPLRRRTLLENLRGRMQVFVTATHPDDLGPAALFDSSHRMSAGGLD